MKSAKLFALLAFLPLLLSSQVVDAAPSQQLHEKYSYSYNHLLATKSISLKIGGTHQLPYKSGYKYHRLSDIDSENTVTVSSKGEVKGIKKGKTLVMIEDSNGNYLDTNYEFDVK